MARKRPTPAAVAAEADAAVVVEAVDSGTAAETAVGIDPEIEDAIEDAVVLSEPQRDPAADIAAAPAAGSAATDLPPVPPATVPPRRGGFWGPALGGAVAAALGAGAALYLLPQGWRPPQADPALPALSAALDTQKAAIAALDSRVQAAETSGKPDLAALREELLAAIPAAQDSGGIDAGLKDLATRVSDIDARLQALESRTSTEAGGAAVPAEVQSEIAALRDELAAQAAAIAEARAAAEAASQTVVAAKAAQDEAASQLAAADAATRQARAEAAIAQLRAAIDSGTPLAPALDALAAAGLNPPDSLRGDAAGVPTLVALQQAFPEAARAALAASAEVPADAGWAGKAAAFLRSQTHARSLAPREGSDPDAVLSRIEAAVREGDLSMAVAKVKALPEPAQASLAQWLDGARRREAAEQALRSLSADAMKGTP